MMAEAERDVLWMLIRHELVIKHLYEVFAAMFAGQRDLWAGLAADEQRHAASLVALRSSLIAAGRSPYVSQLRAQAIKTSIGYVESQIARAHAGGTSALEALAIARDLENALLERQFSKLKDSAPTEMKPVLMSLAEETAQHLKTVKDVMESEKR